MAKQGECVICGTVGPLTRDHVPPAGVATLHGQQESQRILHALGAAPIGNPQKLRVLQSGNIAETLCLVCNNEVLGAGGDAELARMANQLVDAARTNLALPPTFPLLFRPGPVLHSVAGHMLAMNSQPPSVMAPDSSALRDFVLGNAPFPQQAQAWMWFHPFDRTVLWMNYLMTQGFMRIMAGAFLMKFFPVGFLLLFPKDKPLQIPFQATRLDLLARAHGDDEITEPLWLRPLIRADWPEGPSGLDMNVAGDTPGVIVTPRKGRHLMRR